MSSGCHRLAVNEPLLHLRCDASVCRCLLRLVALHQPLPLPLRVARDRDAHVGILIQATLEQQRHVHNLQA